MSLLCGCLLACLLLGSQDSCEAARGTTTYPILLLTYGQGQTGRLTKECSVMLGDLDYEDSDEDSAQDSGDDGPKCLEPNAGCIHVLPKALPPEFDNPNRSYIEDHYCFCLPGFIGADLVVKEISSLGSMCFVQEGKPCQADFLEKRLYPFEILTSLTVFADEIAAEEMRTLSEPAGPEHVYRLTRVTDAKALIASGGGMFGKTQSDWSCFSGTCDPGTKLCGPGQNQYVVPGIKYETRPPPPLAGVKGFEGNCILVGLVLLIAFAFQREQLYA